MSEQAESEHYAVSNSPVIKELMALGIIPPRCHKWSLTAEAGDVVRMESHVFVSDEEFEQIRRILANHPDCAVKTELATKQIDTENDREMLDVTPLGSDWREQIPKP